MALRKIDGGQRERSAGAGVGDRTGRGIAHIARADGGACTGVQVELQSGRLQSRATDADQTDRIDAGVGRQIHPGSYAGTADDQLLGHHQTQIQVLNFQTDRATVRRVGSCDAAIAIGILPVSTDTDEAIGLTDAERQRGDLGDFTVR